MWPLPNWLVEAGNGWLALSLPWVIWTAFRYLRRRAGMFSGFLDFYHKNKMAISILFIVVGAETRTLVVWIVRHLNARSLMPDSPVALLVLKNCAALAYIGGTGIMIAGAICWARVAADVPLKNPRVWAIAAASAVFSVWLATASPI